MVRRALHQTTAAAARDVIRDEPDRVGHHYFVADRTAAFAIEASGTRRKQVFAGGPAYCHTNHCFDKDVEARSKVPATSTTLDRMKWLEADTKRAPVRDLDGCVAAPRQRGRLAAQHLHEHVDAGVAARRGDLRCDRDEPR